MRTRLHLLSMPMYDPLQPSAQLGYLRTHVDRSFHNTIDVRSYSAHLDVMFEWKGADMRAAYVAHRLFGEELFLLTCCFDYPDLFERVYKCYLEFPLPEVHVTREEVAGLCRAMRTYLRSHVLPAFEPNTLNVVGMTTTFAQVFASIFAAKELAALAEAPVLLLFGGASVALPEVRNVLDRWGVAGLVVQGSGEGPLEAVLRACQELPECGAVDPIEAIGSRELTNVSRIGVPARPIDLSLSKEYLQSLGDPDYHEYFGDLRRVCANEQVYRRVLELVAVPLEGSRGCFARCDFCQNPFITTQFRSLDGAKVAEKATRITVKYGVKKIHFADSVCNTWAEGYADTLLSGHTSIDAFMEMRVHAPEFFWTKLALAGVTEMQLGIETVSAPLLLAMNKGTTIWQNLRAAKYLAELGIRSSSNLITHHPKSTSADVEATRRIVSQLDHFPPFSLSRFVVSYASPIFNALLPAQQAALPRGFLWLPPDLRPYTPVRDLAYPYPAEWVDTDVDAAWSMFRIWYQERFMSFGDSPPTLTVRRDGGDLLVEDTRGGMMREYVLSGAEAVILERCHAAPSVRGLHALTGMSVASVNAVLRLLSDRSLVLRLDDHALSLPLRSRSELIANLNCPGSKTTSGTLIPIASYKV